MYLTLALKLSVDAGRYITTLHWVDYFPCYYFPFNPIPTNDEYMYNMCHGCAHFFHKPIRIYMGVLILGVNPLPTNDAYMRYELP